MSEATKIVEKEYQVTLKGSELEFVQDVLTGFDEMMAYASMCYNEHCQFDRGNCDIKPYELASKIFEQCHDEDGKLR